MKFVLQLKKKKMNIDDFNKWLNEELEESESEKITENIMADLKEYRQKEEFKQRLKAQRERRDLIKKGLIAGAFLVAIGILIYMLSQNSKTVAPNQMPTQTPIEAVKPIAEQPQTPENVPTRDSLVFNAKNNRLNEKTIVLDKTSGTIAPPQYSENEVEKPNRQKLSEPITFVRPPIDTEYIYLTSSERRPVYFYTTTENERDTFTTLDLSKEKLTEIPAKVFPYTQLKVLLLNKNQLKNVSNNIAQLVHLEQLDLSKNKLTVLPKALTELANLVFLNLDENKLTALPTDIGQLKQLTTLRVHSNKLAVLPESIGQLSRLTDLDLGDNAIRVLPKEIGQLSNLKLLNLNFNVLIAVPTEIKQLKNLENLNLSFNNIKEFPLEICELSNLTALDFQNNRLWQLPKEIGQLKNLKTLDLSKNMIVRLPKEMRELKNLTYLNLKETIMDYEEIEKIRRWLPKCRIDY